MNIKEAREKQGYTQQQMAKSLRMSVKKYRDIERNETRMFKIEEMIEKIQKRKKLRGFTKMDEFARQYHKKTKFSVDTADMEAVKLLWYALNSTWVMDKVERELRAYRRA